ILKWISPSLPWERHEDIRNDRVDEIGQWLLGTDEFVKWRYGEDGGCNQVLFCHGEAGVGKTYLCSFLLDTLCKLRDEKTELVCGAYCDYYAHGERAIANLLGTLLKQVLSKMKRVPAEVNEAFCQAKTRIDGGIAQHSEILTMLIETLSSVPRASICIDAVDE
ncbi:hypothetical protein L873DRAFT_1642219, partial [Choiromyces venosus 120613-1]